MAVLIAALSLVSLAAPCVASDESSDASATEQSAKPGVLLIALDGAAWNIIDPLIEQGRLPTFKKLVETGARGPLETLPKILSPIIFTTIATGRRPKAHGIHEFVKDAISQVPYTSLDRKTRAIWNILSEHERTVSVVGWMTSWPAEVVRGSFISDRSESAAEGGCYPASLDGMIETTRGKLASAAPEKHLARFIDVEFVNSLRGKKVDSQYEGIVRSLWLHYGKDTSRLEWTVELLKTKPADFTAVFFKGIDVVSHGSWQYMDPGVARGREIPRRAIDAFGQLIPKYYEFMDEAIARLITAAPKDTTVVVVSDHGFDRASPRLHYDANPLVARIGWRPRRLADSSEGGEWLVADGSPGKLAKRRLLVINPKELAKKGATARERRAYVDGLAEKLASVRTVAEEPLFTSVDVLPVTKQPDAAEERYRMRATVNIGVSAIKSDPPDFSVKGDYRFGDGSFPIQDLVTVDPGIGGRHTKEAIFLMAGPGIRKGVELQSVSVYDITPTILELFGLPRAENMSGQVLLEAFDRKPNEPVRPLKTVKTYETGKRWENVTTEPAADSDDEFLEQLKALGYLQ
jgi:predicted AlkP superfamily phosphohydrolase/phosphomutase